MLLTPLDGEVDPLVLAQRWPERYPFLLQSVAHGTPQSRFDLLFCAIEDQLVLESDGRLHRNGQSLPGVDFLNALDDWVTDEQVPRGVGDLPYGGGWFVFLAYELAGCIEPRLQQPPHPGALPIAFAVRCPAAIVIDRSAEQAFAVAEADHAELCATLAEDWSACVGQSLNGTHEPLVGATGIEEEPPQHYLEALERIHEYLLDGDVFQVNLARRWRLPAAGDAVALFDALRRANPAPFAALARWGETAIVSSSPERLVQVAHGDVQTRPIAGTRPRARGSVEADERLRCELVAHPKERAEHIMLIDLERNDLGRICQPGTVEVDELMVVESYAHVHHIVSNVRGRLRPGVTPGSVIRAVFPGGTITGCPKVRCMEIIAELEEEGRGPYTGSLGYINGNGDLDLNILIRTLLVEPEQITFRAGAGIVADSNPAHELAETRSKAKGLLLALEGAVRG